MARNVSLISLLDVFTSGDEWDWEEEFSYLWSNHGERMDYLANSIQETGIQTPILLGNDGRVWDGHHRLAAAYSLGIHRVPVVFSGEEEE